MRWTRMVVSVALIVLSAVACGIEGSPGCGAVEVADSAGIRVVLNPREAPARWVLDGAPYVVVPADDDVEPGLYGVEGGVLLPGGGFVLANSGNHEVLYFGEDGALVRRVGSEGDGPGEFRGMLWIEGRADGGVALWDARLRRLTRLDEDGRVLGSRRFSPEFDASALPSNAILTAGAVLSVLTDGALIGYPRAVAFPSGSRGPLELRADVTLFPDSDGTAPAEDPTRGEGDMRGPGSGSTPEPIGTRTVFHWHENPGREGFPMESVLRAPRIWWGGHSGRFAMTEAVRPEIEVYDEGTLKILIREARRRVPFVPDSLPEEYGAATDSLPAYEDLRVDGLGRVWARITTEDPSTWHLFDASGVLAAEVILAADARVLDADSARILLLRRDELDVESAWLVPFNGP